MPRVLQDVCQKAPGGPWHLADVNKYWLGRMFSETSIRKHPSLVEAVDEELSLCISFLWLL